jgi:hypothetical protein
MKVEQAPGATNVNPSREQHAADQPTKWHVGKPISLSAHTVMAEAKSRRNEQERARTRRLNEITCELRNELQLQVGCQGWQTQQGLLELALKQLKKLRHMGKKSNQQRGQPGQANVTLAPPAPIVTPIIPWPIVCVNVLHVQNMDEEVNDNADAILRRLKEGICPSTSQQTSQGRSQPFDTHTQLVASTPSSGGSEVEIDKKAAGETQSLFVGEVKGGVCTDMLDFTSHDNSHKHPHKLEEWTMEDVQSFLVETGFEEYAKAAKDNQVDGELLQDITAKELKEDLGVTTLKKRRALLAEIENLKASARLAAKTTCQPEMRTAHTSPRIEVADQSTSIEIGEPDIISTSIEYDEPDTMEIDKPNTLLQDVYEPNTYDVYEPNTYDDGLWTGIAHFFNAEPSAVGDGAESFA